MFSGIGSQSTGTGGSQETETHTSAGQLDISSQALNSGQLIREIKRLRERYSYASSQFTLLHTLLRDRYNKLVATTIDSFRGTCGRRVEREQTDRDPVTFI